MKAKVLKIQNDYYYFNTQKTLANYLGVSEHTLINWCKTGKDSAFNGLIKIENYDPQKHTKNNTTIIA